MGFHPAPLKVCFMGKLYSSHVVVRFKKRLIRARVQLRKHLVDYIAVSGDERMFIIPLGGNKRTVVTFI